MYAKITDGVVSQYPYTIRHLRRDNPNVSFPEKVSSQIMFDYGAVVVTMQPFPSYDADRQVVIQDSAPVLINGEWTLGWAVRDKTAEELEQAYTEKAAQVRAERDRKLAECDWVTLKAVDASNDNLGIQLPQVWMTYRQALRDITAQAGFPWNVTWPEKP